MANLAVNDICVVTFRGSLLGQVILNSFGYKATTVGGAHTNIATGLAMEAAMNAGGVFMQRYLDCVPSNYHLDEFWFQNIRPFRQAKQIITENLDGNRATPALQPNTASVITKKGAGGSRRNIGSLHLPLANSSDDVIAGFLTTDLKLALSTFALEVIAPIPLFAAAVIMTPIIVSPDPAVVHIPIVATEIQDTARVMRRRTVRVGI